MKEGLEGLVAKHVFFLDTSVLMLNAFAPYVLANAWESIRDDPFGQQLIEAAEKQRRLKRHPNHVVICDLVTRELDNLMHDHKQPHLKAMAARARSVLGDIRDRGQIAQGDSNYVLLENGARVYFVGHDEEQFSKKARFDPNIDDRLVWNFERVYEANRGQPYELQFVSQDKICRDLVRDRVASLLAGDPRQTELVLTCAGEFEFENAVEDPHQAYTGSLKIEVSPEEYREYRLGSVELTEPSSRARPLRPLRIKKNQFLEVRQGSERALRIVKAEGNRLHARPLVHYEGFLDAAGKHKPERRLTEASEVEVPKDVQSMDDVRSLFRSDASLNDDYKASLAGMVKRNADSVERAYQEVYLSLHRHRTKNVKGIFQLPFNRRLQPKKEQQYALELLNDPNITVVSLVGPPGTGKTLWALYAGLVQLSQERYKEIVYFRPPIGLNEGHGFVKGDLRQKLDIWLKPCKDALVEIFGGYGGSMAHRKAADEEVKRLEKEGRLILNEADTHQQGATWRDRYVVIDEAQLLTRDQMRVMVNRVGEGDAKLVLIGDPDQIGGTASVTHWFLNRRNNGLTHVVERLQGQQLYGHVTFTEEGTIMRSRTARELGRLL